MAVKIQIQSPDGNIKTIILYEHSISWVEKGENNTTLVHLDSGEVLTVTDPPYINWENDALL